MRQLHIGIVGSSNGGVARELIGAIGSTHKFFVVTDRPCGLEVLADECGIPRLRIEESKNEIFSQFARDFFEHHGDVDIVLLFFLRLVTPELYEKTPTFNIHPSLLPEYPGFSALERAYADQVERFGATLHLVDEKPDSGAIVAQVATLRKSTMNLEQMRRISFAQKTYLALYLVEYLESICDPEMLYSDQHRSNIFNPPLKNTRYREYYHRFVLREGIQGAL